MTINNQNLTGNPVIEDTQSIEEAKCGNLTFNDKRVLIVDGWEIKHSIYWLIRELARNENPKYYFSVSLRGVCVKEGSFRKLSSKELKQIIDEKYTVARLRPFGLEILQSVPNITMATIMQLRHWGDALDLLPSADPKPNLSKPYSIGGIGQNRRG